MASIETRKPNRVAWSTTDAIIGTVLTLTPLIALNLVGSAASGTTSSSVLEAVFVIAPLIYARLRAGRDGTRQLGLRGFNPALALGLMVLGAAAFVALSDAYSYIATKFPNSPLTGPTNLDQLTQEVHQMPLVVGATLLAAVLVAPICEEIFFRGFLLMGLRNSMPTWLAILLTSLVFAVAHLSPGSFVLLFILAIILGILRVTTNSLWPGIILHALNNALGFLVVFSVK
jgi:membrane protease YdiL (CAAX protease family)